MDYTAECTTVQTTQSTTYVDLNPVLEVPYEVPDTPFAVRLHVPYCSVNAAGGRVGLIVVNADQPTMVLASNARRFANANDAEAVMAWNRLTAAKLQVQPGTVVPLRARYKVFTPGQTAKLDANTLLAVTLQVVPL